MKNKVIAIIFAVTLVVSACTGNSKNEENKTASNVSSNHIKTVGVKVLKEKEVPNYSYMFVSDKGNNYWIAASKMQVKVGDSVYYNGAIQMNNFKSATLDTTFETIFFVNKCSTSKADLANEAFSGVISSFHKSAEKDKVVKVNLKKNKGELTIADLFKDKDKYNGKVVTIRGVVVKYLPEIMNKNWIHLQDGTEYSGNNEIVITTLDKTEKGKTVTFKGKLSTNVDFGYGYKYNVIIQNAHLVK